MKSKKMTESVPFLSDPNKAKKMLQDAIQDLLTDATSDRTIVRTHASLVKKYMHKRQAPTEILQSNEVEEPMEEPEIPEAPEDSDESIKEDKGQDFSQVKLASKYAAVLVQGKEYYLSTCVQNTHIPGQQE